MNKNSKNKITKLLAISLSLIFIQNFSIQALDVNIVKSENQNKNKELIKKFFIQTIGDCGICSETCHLIKLSCGLKDEPHSMCYSCLSNWQTNSTQNNQETTCPYCRTVAKIDGIDGEDLGIQLSNYKAIKDEFNQLLVKAIKANKIDKVKFLLENNVDVNTQAKESLTPLMHATIKGHIEIVKLLLSNHRININARDFFGHTAFIWAAKFGHTEIAKLLLANPDINVTGILSTPLTDAARSGHIETVKLLLSHPKFNHIDLKAPLAFAVRNGHIETVKLLLSHSDIDFNTKDNCTVLMWAVETGHIEIVKLLFSHSDINVNVKDNFGDTALAFAARNGQTEVVKLLFSHSDINVKSKNEDNCTALIYAVKNGHTKTIKFLLSHSNIDVNAQNKYSRNTALIEAALCGHTKIVELLLTHPNIDIYIQNKYKQTALNIAKNQNNNEIIELIENYIWKKSSCIIS